MEQYFDAVDDTAWKRGRARADAAAERAVADATARAAAAEARAAAAEARADAAEVRADAAEVRADAAEAAAETANRSVISRLRKDVADAEARADAADAQAVWHRYCTPPTRATHILCVRRDGRCERTLRPAMTWRLRSSVLVTSTCR
jgi:hypothetical protein